MFENYAEVLTLLDFVGGSVVGRKKLQKLVYLAQQKGWPFPEQYRYYLYGPFSEQLANEIEEMKAFGFVTEEKSGYGAALCCSLTQQGKELIGKVAGQPLPVGIEDLVVELSQRDARILELMATALFLLKHGHPKNGVSDTIRNLKPEQEYCVREIDETLAFLYSRGFLEQVTGG